LGFAVDDQCRRGYLSKERLLGHNVLPTSVSRIAFECIIAYHFPLQCLETLPRYHPALDVGGSQASHQMYVPLCSPYETASYSRLPSVAANSYWGNMFTNNGAQPMTQSLAIITGCAAGATESFVVTPFELVKIRLQDKASTYTSPSDVIKKTIARDGPLGLYNGMEATFWRHVSWSECGAAVDRA
jgi:hypothetical protein